MLSLYITEAFRNIYYRISTNCVPYICIVNKLNSKRKKSFVAFICFHVLYLLLSIPKFLLTNSVAVNLNIENKNVLLPHDNCFKM